MNEIDITQLKYEDRWVDLSELETDRRVQRALRNPTKVDEYRKAWNDNLAGIVSVSHRENGAMAVIDGDHRTAAKINVDPERTTTPGQIFCRVFEGLSFAEEGYLFIKLNPGNQPSVYDLYRVGVFTGEPQATRIDKIIHSRGYVASNASGAGNINAIKVLRELDNIDQRIRPEGDESGDSHLLDAVLRVVSRSWGDDKHGLQGPILQGIGYLVAEYASRIDWNVLVDVLRGYKGGPFGLLTDARQVVNMKGGRKSMAVAERIVDEYNKGRSKRTLPAWGKRK